MTDKGWTTRARQGDYRALEAAADVFPMDWAVDGLLPATGATVWFGSGSTGKTQLLLWLAAHVAARGEGRPQEWLGAEVKAKGHVLVLSAEDLREHLYQRIGTIVRSMANVDQRVDIEDVCSRIHVMPFLSMAQNEFDDLNPCLFERGDEGRWSPSRTLNDVERFLEDWNDEVSAEGREDDRIVGVILDSAVSMAGFEMANSEATTNFLFHINRMSRRQGMFWAIIGHTPKDAGKRTDDAAIERLRGSAMWSTTPRSVIEVRVANSADNVDEALAANPGLSTRDIVFVSVAKANSQGADLRPRALKRVIDGAFVDISREFPSVFQNARANAAGESDAKREPILEPENAGAARMALIKIVENLTEGGKGDIGFTRTNFQEAFLAAAPSQPVLAGISSEVDSQHFRTKHCLAWYLYKFKDAGALTDKKSKFYVSDLSKIRPAASNDVDLPDAA